MSRSYIHEIEAGYRFNPLASAVNVPEPWQVPNFEIHYVQGKRS